MVKPGRLYVGNLSSATRVKDLEEAFSKYGEISNIDRKIDYAFVEYMDSHDAEEAVRSMDRQELNGSSINVEYARDPEPRERDYERGPPRRPYHRPPPRGPLHNDVCYNCGRRGHWANECREGDWSNKCYRCGGRGHLRRDCKASRSLEKETPRSTRYRDYEDRYAGGGGGGRYYHQERYDRHPERYSRKNYHSRSPERYGRSHRYDDRHRRESTERYYDERRYDRGHKDRHHHNDRHGYKRGSSSEGRYKGGSRLEQRTSPSGYSSDRKGGKGRDYPPSGKSSPSYSPKQHSPAKRSSSRDNSYAAHSPQNAGLV